MSEIKDKLLVGINAESDDPVSEASPAIKERLLNIFLQLGNSHRFLTFLEKNFVIQDRIDDETKTIDTLVIENPIAVGPPLNSGQLVEIRNVIRLYGSSDPDKALESILKLLGQDGVSLIQMP